MNEVKINVLHEESNRHRPDPRTCSGHMSYVVMVHHGGWPGLAMTERAMAMQWCCAADFDWQCWLLKDDTKVHLSCRVSGVFFGWLSKAFGLFWSLFCPTLSIFSIFTFLLLILP